MPKISTNDKKRIKKIIESLDSKKKCIYCGNITSENPHFESQCCGRGMCDNCYSNLDCGTDEQIQLDYFDDEDNIIKPEYKNATYLCFGCEKIWSKGREPKLQSA